MNTITYNHNSIISGAQAEIKPMSQYPSSEDLSPLISKKMESEPPSISRQKKPTNGHAETDQSPSYHSIPSKTIFIQSLRPYSRVRFLRFLWKYDQIRHRKQPVRYQPSQRTLVIHHVPVLRRRSLLNLPITPEKFLCQWAHRRKL